MVKIIVAIGKEGEIGKQGDLIWRIPEDLKRFKRLTTGGTVIMGRKTWESLPKRPLPNRRNIIITRQKDYKAEGAEVICSPQDALNLCKDTDPFIIGGAEVYKAFLPLTDELLLTEVDCECIDADTRLHLNLEKDWQEIEKSEIHTTPEGVVYRYATYRRKV